MKKLFLGLVLVMITATSSFAVDPFATGVVGRWKLSENAGNTAGWIDLSANGNDLTGVGAPTAGSGFTAATGDAVQLTAASSQKLNITSAAATGLHDFASAFTISAWINPDSATGTDATILGTWTQPNQRAYVLVRNAGSNTIGIYISSGGSSFINLNTTTAPTVGVWTHVFCLWTGTQLELYLNNASAATPVAYTAGIAAFANDWCVGSQDNCLDKYFDGRIDDVTLWDRALSSDERTYVYGLRGEFDTGSQGVGTINSSDSDRLTSLAGVTGVGAGTTNLVEGSRCSHSWSTGITGAPTAVTTTLEGSVDGGSTWFTLDTSTAIIDNLRHVVDKCVNAVRSNLTTLTGGTSPTITTIIESTQ